MLVLQCCLALHADDEYDIRQFDEDAGLSHGHASQILQDNDGFLWIATWNGLNRFDGYEFQRIHSQASEDWDMPSNRFRNIWLAQDGNIYCKVDDDLLLFDLHSYRFRHISDSTECQQAEDLLHQSDHRGHFNGQFIDFIDRQGLLWELHQNAVFRLRPIHQPAHALPQQQVAQVRCMARDQEGRIWIATKEDATLRIFDSQLQLLGYLSADGKIHQQYTSFGSPIYCMTQSSDGTIWLGSKPDGLFRLRESSPLHFSIQHIADLPNNDIYDIKEDRFHRLWIATLHGGILCRHSLSEESKVSQFENDVRVRFLHITSDDILLATSTTEGVLVGKIEKDIKRIHFHRHRKDVNRPSSISCNATMDILEKDGRMFISTESGGVVEILSKNLLADTLSFQRLPLRSEWPSDVAISLMPSPDGLLITSNCLLMDYHLKDATATVLDRWFFNAPYRFCEVHPLPLDDGRWLFATMEGAFSLDPQQMKHVPYVPPIALTAIRIQNGNSRLAVNHLDSLVLSPEERSLTIQFASLDYRDASRIRYAFSLNKENDEDVWNNIGFDHSVTLLDLQPGTYQLLIRSTNADGTWVDNMRRLTIIVKPTFWETPWAILLIVCLSLAIIGVVVHTLFYIRRINRQRQETLEAYLALLNREEKTKEEESTSTKTVPIPQLNEEDERFMQQLMSFTEQHISNSDISVGDMADALATSRSGLQRRIKHLMGITPQDFLREARIKRACQLLQQTQKPIAEVAYDCGFTDPKYFSRCFKQSVGQSPTDFRSI